MPYRIDLPKGHYEFRETPEGAVNYAANEIYVQNRRATISTLKAHGQVTLSYGFNVVTICDTQKAGCKSE